MVVKEEKDCLYLIWKDKKTRNQYTIGELSKNDGFEFKYFKDIQKAMEKGFKLLLSFEDETKVYKNKKLFGVFSSRLPDSRRKDINSILKKYGLNEYDEYELLKKVVLNYQLII